MANKEIKLSDLLNVVIIDDVNPTSDGNPAQAFRGETKQAYTFNFEGVTGRDLLNSTIEKLKILGIYRRVTDSYKTLNQGHKNDKAQTPLTADDRAALKVWTADELAFDVKKEFFTKQSADPEKAKKRMSNDIQTLRNQGMTDAEILEHLGMGN